MLLWVVDICIDQLLSALYTFSDQFRSSMHPAVDSMLFELYIQVVFMYGQLWN
jgi:hypothetical protein